MVSSVRAPSGSVGSGWRCLGDLRGLRLLLLEDLLVVHRHDLDELRAAGAPVVQHVLRHARARVVDVRLKVTPYLLLLLLRLDLLERDHPHVTPVRELALRVDHVRDATGHAGGEVAPGLAQAHHAAARHVLAAVVPHPLHHRDGARVAHREALAGDPPEVRLAPRGAVQAHVAHHDVVLRHKALGQHLVIRVHRDLSAREALAHAVVRVAGHVKEDALGEGEAQGLAAVPVELDVDGAVRQPLLAVAFAHLVREHGAQSAGEVVGRVADLDRRARLERRHGVGQDLVVDLDVELVVLHLGVDDARVRVQRGGRGEERREVEAHRLVVEERLIHLEAVRLAHHLLKRAVAELGHVLAHLLRQQPEKVHHMLRLPRELGTEEGVLRGHADRAGVEVALSHHDTAEGDQRGGGERHLLRAEQGGDHHVAPVLDLSVRLQAHARAEVVEDEGLLGLGHSELPRETAPLQAGPRRGAGAAVVARHHDVVGLGLDRAGSDDADADLRDELDRDLARGLGALEVVDELGEILDRVDVVVRRRRDQADTGGRAAALANVRSNFEAWELAALSWLGALCHLDLNLVRVGKVVARHAEAAARHLLDRRAPVVREAHRVLAALARVRARADRVHGDGEGLVSLLRDRAKRHGAGGEPLDNLGHGLDLVDGDGGLRVDVEGHDATERDLGVGLVDVLGVHLVRLARVRLGRLLQQHHGRRGVEVRLAAVTVVEVARVGQERNLGGRVRVGRVVEAANVGVKTLEVAALNAASRAGKATVDHLVGETDGLEDLGALVRLEGRDTHLGHDLEDALGGTLAVVVEELLVAELLLGAGQHLTIGAHLGEGLVGHVRADSVAAKAEHRGKVVHLTRVAALGEEGGLGALLGTEQVLVHGADRQQRRDREAVGAGEFVREHDGLGAVGAVVALDGLRHLSADGREGVVEALRPRTNGEGGIDDGPAPSVELGGFDRLHLLKGEDRVVDHEAGAVLRPRDEEVRLGPDGAHQRHDHLLTDRVDRRVGHLREELLEVIEDVARLRTEDGEGGIVTHRPEGLLATNGHRIEKHVHRLRGVAEHIKTAIRLVKVEVVHRGLRVSDPRLKVDEVVLNPLAVGGVRGHLLLDRLIIHDLGRVEVDEEHLSRLEARLDLHLIVVQVGQHANLRGE
mmetsp:Transcript_100539/g.288012  ORF Transcript_100539/g.288012 Transcript_100539/m.288012 type:complete len:1151 (+) Transcript_100539:506-3958(+)